MRTMLIERWNASPLAQRWQGLSPRDRLALAGLGAFLALALLYLAAWRPAERQRDAATAYFLQQRDLNAYLQSRAPAADNLSRTPQARIDPQRLQGFITGSAQEQGLSVDRMDNGGDGLQVSLQPAAFGTLLRWFQQLQTQGVSVSEAALERTADGNVTARLTLRANP